jgi:hypothetical protein
MNTIYLKFQIISTPVILFLPIFILNLSIPHASSSAAASFILSNLFQPIEEALFSISIQITTLLIKQVYFIDLL